MLEIPAVYRGCGGRWRHQPGALGRGLSRDVVRGLVSSRFFSVGVWGQGNCTVPNVACPTYHSHFSPDIIPPFLPSPLPSPLLACSQRWQLRVPANPWRQGVLPQVGRRGPAVQRHQRPGKGGFCSSCYSSRCASWGVVGRMWGAGVHHAGKEADTPADPHTHILVVCL